MRARYRFGGVEFDPGTGALRPLGTRLPRQPARLLELLIEKRGGVVSRREIRDELWSDTNVEFDKSLHFCIHQVRSALGDSATEPTFVETIPRQGYRLLPEVERLEEPDAGAKATAGKAADAGRAMRLWRGQLIPVVFGVALALAALLASDLLVNGTSPKAGTVVAAGARSPAEPAGVPEQARIRIGVMPFEPPADWKHAAVPEIAEWILEVLTLAGEDRAWIVGPSTTSAYADKTLAELAADYELDFIVNGRFLADALPPMMLAELVRTDDGAHIWVERVEVDRLADGRRLGHQISAAVVERLLGASPDVGDGAPTLPVGRAR